MIFNNYAKKLKMIINLNSKEVKISKWKLISNFNLYNMNTPKKKKNNNNY